MSGPILAGRCGIVTGATAGIGEALALAFASAGAAVVVNGRREERLDALAHRLRATGASVATAPGDAADDAVIQAMFSAAHTLAPAGPDLVVANAGRGLAGSVMTSDPAQWEELIRVNLLGCARLMRAAGQAMARQAQRDPTPLAAPRDLVVISSVVGRHVSPFSSLYGSTKFAVTSLAEAARRELGPQGVRVTVVEPAIVRSEFQQVAGYTHQLVEDFERKFGPLLEPEDVARMIVFAVSQPPHVHVSDLLVRPTRQDYP